MSRSEHQNSSVVIGMVIKSRGFKLVIIYILMIINYYYIISLQTYSQTLTSSVIYLSVCCIHLKLELLKRPASNDNNFKYPIRKIDKCVLDTFNEVKITHKHLITYRKIYFGVKLWP